MKNVLSGAESESKVFNFCVDLHAGGSHLEQATKQDLVTTLQHLIHEQNRIDIGTSGVSNNVEITSPIKETVAQASANTSVPLQMVLPGDVKKIRKQTKQLFTDKGESIVQLFYGRSS